MIRQFRNACSTLEAMNFGFVRHELREDAAEAKCVFAKGRPHPVAAGRRGVAFVDTK
jgi:hypothetical protein